MCADYYLVRKGYLQTRNLYSADRKGPYFFHGGVSWRGYAAYLAGILPNVVGFVGAVGVDVPKGKFFFLFSKKIKNLYFSAVFLKIQWQYMLSSLQGENYL